MNFVNLLFELYWHLGSISWNWEPTWTSSTATTNTSTETRLKSGFQIHTNTPEKRMLLYSAQNCLVTYSYHWKLQRMHSRGHVLVMRSEFLIFCLLLCILLGLLNPPPFSRRKKRFWLLSSNWTIIQRKPVGRHDQDVVVDEDSDDQDDKTNWLKTWWCWSHHFNIMKYYDQDHKTNRLKRS